MESSIPVAVRLDELGRLAFYLFLEFHRRVHFAHVEKSVDVIGDAAPNEAKDAEQPDHSTKANPYCVERKACRRPLRQDHVVCPSGIGEQS